MSFELTGKQRAYNTRTCYWAIVGYHMRHIWRRPFEYAIERFGRRGAGDQPARQQTLGDLVSARSGICSATGHAHNSKSSDAQVISQRHHIVGPIEDFAPMLVCGKPIAWPISRNYAHVEFFEH